MPKAGGSTAPRVSRSSATAWSGATSSRRSEVLRAYVDAQVLYAQEDHDGDDVLEYAQRIGSSPGTRDGLYWPAEPGQETSPFGPFLAAAGVNVENRQSDAPYYGYYFRIMPRQGEDVPGGAYDYVINGNMVAGFAMVAWPAQYGDTGIMTFVVNQRDVVREKDMGPGYRGDWTQDAYLQPGCELGRGHRLRPGRWPLSTALGRGSGSRYRSRRAPT